MRQNRYGQTKQCIMSNQPTYDSYCKTTEVTKHHRNLASDYYDHQKTYEIVKHLKPFNLLHANGPFLHPLKHQKIRGFLMF